MDDKSFTITKSKYRKCFTHVSRWHMNGHNSCSFLLLHIYTGFHRERFRRRGPYHKIPRYFVLHLHTQIGIIFDTLLFLKSTNESDMILTKLKLINDLLTNQTDSNILQSVNAASRSSILNDRDAWSWFWITDSWITSNVPASSVPQKMLHN